MILFNCDYLEGCHPKILERLVQTNLEQTTGYGLDPHCKHATELIRKTFDCPESNVHFLVGGTQTNTTVIAATLKPYEGVLSADTGHINVHETGAIEATGHKVLPLRSMNGKITADQVREAVELQADFEHTVKPGMVYISLSTEYGTLYSLSELKALYTACQELNIPLFIDGARLGYALASPANDIPVTEIAKLCDVFYIGGTKVGALFGEALVISNERINHDFRYMIKRHGGMLAKGRLLGIQFEVLMEDGLYFEIAQKAVGQAMAIRDALIEKNIPLLIDSPTNQLFPVFSTEQAAQLQKQFEFEFWERLDANRTCLRICTSWATTDENVEKLIGAIEAL